MARSIVDILLRLEHPHLKESVYSRKSKTYHHKGLVQLKLRYALEQQDEPYYLD